ncbi:shikimate dehydrogenase [Phenylobacterium sp.]|uniref:shikimate dehydrogenase n=1 Tax=Phenylobacterium sp. TaxID=1871053 RepID=UPI0027321A5C|nr:shikimate dehydrogenase [Phenylobacterium sp.]MDP1599941.1 shikimate dehydrogenase [Phenylobacterium sp.]MDP3593065.1 shikimate dehydrogenase [Phenylobacterium sp.]
MSISGATRVAGVVGRPISHSMSPILHNAWLAAAGMDGVYVPFSVQPGRFTAFVDSLRGGTVSGLNVTLPFKGEALALADEATFRARTADAANVLVFREDGTILADNTDGLGMLRAFAEQAPGFDPKAGPVVILGAGGGSRGAAAAFVEAGCRDVRIVNRTLTKAQDIAEPLGAAAFALNEAAKAFDGAVAVVNATSAGLSGSPALDLPLEATPPSAVIMDMVYKPLKTPLLAQAEGLGRQTVDGLAMLIGQAVPSFEAFYGQTPPESVDVRALALKALGL